MARLREIPRVLRGGNLVYGGRAIALTTKTDKLFLPRSGLVQRPWGLRGISFSGLFREEFKQREIIHDPDIFPSAKGHNGG